MELFISDDDKGDFCIFVAEQFSFPERQEGNRLMILKYVPAVNVKNKMKILFTSVFQCKIYFRCKLNIDCENGEEVNSCFE